MMDVIVDMMHLRCYDTLGNLQWNITWIQDPDLFIPSVDAIAADTTAVYVATGYFNLTSYQNLVFLTKFSASDGTELWSTQISPAHMTGVNDMEINGSRIYLDGRQHPDVGISCYSTATGANIWDATWVNPGSSSATPGGIAVNGSKVYLTSHYDFATLCLAEYSNSGTQLWNITWKWLGNETFAHGIVANTTGIYVGFDTYFHDGFIATPDYTPGVVKFNSTGDEQWNTTLTHPTHDGRAEAIVLDGGDVYLLSQLRNPFLGLGNISLAQFNSTGAVKGEYLYQTYGEDIPKGLAADNGQIYVSGTTTVVHSLPVTGVSSTGMVAMDNFLLRCDTTPSPVWTRHHYAQGNEYVLDTAIADTRGVVVVGDCQNGDQGLDQYIALLRFNGDLQWEYRWGGSSHEAAYAVVVDGPYIYVAGIRTTYSWNDLVLSCFTTDGALVWINSWRPQLNIHIETGVDLQLNQDYLFVAGTVFNATSPSLDYDVFVARFDTFDGSNQWDTVWGSDELEFGFSLTVQLPYVYVGALESQSGSRNASLVCFTTSGVYNWNTTWGDNLAFEKVSVATDGTSVYLAGSISDYYNYPFTTVNESFIVAYDLGGTEKWSTTWGQPDRYEVTNAIFTSDNTLYVAGFTSTVAWFYWEDAFIAAFDVAGTHQWTLQNNGSRLATAQAVVAQGGTIFMAGVTRNGQQYHDYFVAAYGSGLIGLSDLIVHAVDDLGTPLSGAIVYSTHDGCPTGQSPVATTTNTTGHAEFSGLIPGNFTFAGTKTGYQVNKTTIELALGGNYQTSLTLPRLGGIRVQVLDAAGIPLVGVPIISLTQPLGQPPLGGITTNPEIIFPTGNPSWQYGHVYFEYVIPGNYTLYASPTGCPSVSGDVRVQPGQISSVTLVVPTSVLVLNLGPVFIGVIIGIIALVIIVFVWLLWKERPK
jgi:hypothetical protein